jgi:hypothetical protein
MSVVASVSPTPNTRFKPELPHPPIEGGGVESYYSWEQVRVEPLRIPQERAFALHTPQLLEQSEGEDLRVRKSLYGLVASRAVGVEQGVGVVY